MKDIQQVMDSRAEHAATNETVDRWKCHCIIEKILLDGIEFDSMDLLDSGFVDELLHDYNLHVQICAAERELIRSELYQKTMQKEAWDSDRKIPFKRRMSNGRRTLVMYAQTI